MIVSTIDNHLQEYLNIKISSINLEENEYGSFLDDFLNNYLTKKKDMKFILSFIFGSYRAITTLAYDDIFYPLLSTLYHLNYANSYGDTIYPMDKELIRNTLASYKKRNIIPETTDDHYIFLLMILKEMSRTIEDYETIAKLTF